MVVTVARLNHTKVADSTAVLVVVDTAKNGRVAMVPAVVEVQIFTLVTVVDLAVQVRVDVLTNVGKDTVHCIYLGSSCVFLIFLVFFRLIVRFQEKEKEEKVP